MTERTVNTDPLLTAAEAAKYLSVGVQTLERWRRLGGGPTYRRLSEGTIRYRRSDLEAFLKQRVES